MASKAKLRQTLSERAFGCCEYCACPEAFSPQTFSIEHIVPLALDGSNLLENLAFACQGCNSFKSDKIAAPDPVGLISVPLFNPRRDIWTEHFRWDESCRRIIGISPTGRATVVALRLNRDFVVNLRQLLSLAELHPPGHFR